jgi:hypothetical protein
MRQSFFLFPVPISHQALSSASSSVDCAVQPKIVFALLYQHKPQ